jgi:hypothetical protein
MARELVAHNKPIFNQLHPRIYAAAVGFVAWFAVAAWVLFDRRSDTGLPLAIVSVFFLVAVLLPWSMFLVWKRHRMPEQRHPNKTSFHDWRTGDFAVWGAKLHGTRAANRCAAAARGCRDRSHGDRNCVPDLRGRRFVEHDPEKACPALG